VEREAGSLMTESAHGGQSRISLSRGRGRRVDSTLEVLVMVWPLRSPLTGTKGGRGGKGGGAHASETRSRRQGEGHLVQVPIQVAKAP